jgi:hypothetical protein
MYTIDNNCIRVYLKVIYLNTNKNYVIIDYLFEAQGEKTPVII